MAAFQVTPPSVSFHEQSTSEALDPDTEAPGQWEYEYSTTETESYYVTLDLTTPQVPTKPRRDPVRLDKEAKRLKWPNPGLGRNQRRNLHLTRKGRKNWGWEGVKGSDDEDEDLENGSNSSADEQPPAAPEPNEKKNGDGTEADGSTKRPENIRILELHSKNPLVSYDGQIYSCRWVENIGTEMLFMRHGDGEGIQTLRSNLPGEVDLLAASSARIVSTAVRMEPKASNPVPVNLKKGKRPKQAAPKINVGHGARAERKAQGRFLERFIDIKHAKGEKDYVTVVANKRHTVLKWSNVLKEKRIEEKRELREILENADDYDVDDVEKAGKRLEYIIADDKRREKIEEGKRKRGPRKRRKAGLPRGSNAPKDVFGFGVNRTKRHTADEEEDDASVNAGRSLQDFEDEDEDMGDRSMMAGEEYSSGGDGYSNGAGDGQQVFEDENGELYYEDENGQGEDDDPMSE